MQTLQWKFFIPIRHTGPAVSEFPLHPRRHQFLSFSRTQRRQKSLAHRVNSHSLCNRLVAVIAIHQVMLYAACRCLTENQQKRFKVWISKLKWLVRKTEKFSVRNSHWEWVIRFKCKALGRLLGYSFLSLNCSRLFSLFKVCLAIALLLGPSRLLPLFTFCLNLKV